MVVMSGILVSIYDAKADSYTHPSVASSDADAIRQFSILVNDREGTLLALHPEDFTLFRIGSFDCCKIVGEDRKSLANGIDVKVKQEVAS